MSRPLVSVIVPVYNGEETLGRALESLFAQDYHPFEVIVVDDGSTDRSGEIARSFPGVTYLRQANAGPAAARNAGIAAARGDLIAFLDADDAAPPTKLSVQADYLVDHPQVGCVLGRQEIVFEGLEQPSWFTRDPIFGDLEGINLIGAMLRTSALTAVGGFDPDRTLQGSEDRDLMIRLRAAGIGLEVVNEVVLRRYFHGSNQKLKRPGSRLLQSLHAKLERERADATTPERAVE